MAEAVLHSAEQPLFPAAPTPDRLPHTTTIIQITELRRRECRWNRSTRPRCTEHEAFVHTPEIVASVAGELAQGWAGLLYNEWVSVCLSQDGRSFRSRVHVLFCLFVHV